MCHAATNIGILSRLENKIAASGDLINLHCSANGTSVVLKINNSQPSQYEALGFNIIRQTGMTGGSFREINFTVIVAATQTINNTRISCTAYGLPTSQGDQVETEATITVVGNAD